MSETKIQDHYREMLRDQLSQRCERRKNFSLRAFARQLGIDHAQLSRVLNGKKNLSFMAAQSIADKAFSNQKDRKRFLAALEYALAKTPASKEQALKKISRLGADQHGASLTLEAFKIISQWQHFAILDLTAVEGVPHSVSAFASYLGISEIGAKLAVERLIKLGLLQKRGARYVKTNSVLATPTDVPNLGLRRFHRQMINKAIDSLESQSIDRRYVVGKTMSIRREDLPKYKTLVEEFFSEVDALATTALKPSNALYQLNVQLFDLGTKYQEKRR